MKDRIVLLIKARNLTAAQFADEIGVQKSSISHIISGRNNASLDFIQKILLRYPEVNMNWLLFGKGPIFKEAEIESGILNYNQIDAVEEQVSASVDLFSVLDKEKPVNFYKENEFSSHSDETETTKNVASESILSKRNDFETINKKPEPIKKQGQENIFPAHGFNSSKRVIKILEFYSDNTYREYYPEN